MSRPEQISRTGCSSPVEMAAELSHLPGFFFLDSSSFGEDVAANSHSRFSLITACPRFVISGNLFRETDRAKLKSLYEAGLSPEGSTPDLGFPNAGLYGCITYEGDFVFGEYHEFLIFDHQFGRWREEHCLSSQRRALQVVTEERHSPIVFDNDLDRDQFCRLVGKAKEHIAAGDIYQVNLCHRFHAPLPEDFDAFSLYAKLREQSPAPFAAFSTLGERIVMSSSPEQFLSLSGRMIQTRPIKGTRPRFRDREKDERSAYDLITSPKEIAELVMITDLERNDLGQICEFGSVVATELLKLERYAQVFHLVSTIEGTLRPDLGHIDAVHACFPGGSITGAPKKRAREIIHDLEPCPRGLYTGVIGCFGFNGESRFNIAIRTLIAEAGQLHFHVGAGIVADSIPGKEWEETLHKAAGILQACEVYGV